MLLSRSISEDSCLNFFSAMAYIKTINYENSTDELKTVYNNLIKSRGKIAEIHKIHSLNPDVLVKHMELYMAIMFGKSPLKRYQREMIGVVVSNSNKCDYCVNHHVEALLAYWKDEERAELILDPKRRKKAGLTDAEILLCELADELTVNPSAISNVHIQKLKDAGISDRDILDATQVIAYFNFVNRLVLGLGVEFTEEEVKGYKY